MGRYKNRGTVPLLYLRLLPLMTIKKVALIFRKIYDKINSMKESEERLAHASFPRVRQTC
jgi:hypothetical protein